MAGYCFLAEARLELATAVDYYDSEYPGLGQALAREARRLCDLIAEEPLVGQVVRPGIRRRLLRRFPYAVLYSLDDDEILIVAVAHQSREPG